MIYPECRKYACAKRGLPHFIYNLFLSLIVRHCTRQEFEIIVAHSETRQKFEISFEEIYS